MIPTTVAIDLGGTRLRLAASNPRGQGVRWEEKAVPPSHLPLALGKIWKKNNWTVVPLLIVGSKGIWTIRERNALRKSIQRLATEVRVMSDVELAMHAAFARTQNVSDRIFIVSGTGSIALGMTKSGALLRAGGLGPQRGDEGSGWWIGNEYLRRMKHRKTSGNPSQVAALAKQVLANAPHFPLCSAIIREAQTHLASLIVDVHRQMKSRASLSISWGGSLMLDNNFRRNIRATVKQKIHRPLRWIHPKSSPDQAAAQQPERIPQGLPTDLPPRFFTNRDSPVDTGLSSTES